VSKNGVIILLKVVVSLGLIGVLVWNIEPAELLAGLRTIDPPFAVFALALLSIQFLVSTWKWRISLRIHGLEYSFGYLLKILCISFFFNNFLPTAIGGDVYRAIRTMDGSASRFLPFSAVILERLLGISVLLLFGLMAEFWLLGHDQLRHPDFISLTILGAALSALVASVLWKLGLHTAVLARLKVIKKLEPLLNSMRRIRDNRRQLLPLLGVSLLFQSIAILAISVLFQALGHAMVLAESAFTAAAAGIVGVLPVSINGIGVVEGSFVVAAYEANLPQADALVVALFLRGFMLASSVLCGVVYLFELKGGLSPQDTGAP
jgi:glycosyltransferase 2 family protein